MNKSISVLALGLICGLALVGCGSKEKQLEGKWHATDISIPAGQNPQAAAMVKGMMSSITLEFTPDKKFTMTVMFPMTGDWSMQGSGVTMTMKTIMGMNMDQVKAAAKSQPGGNSMMAQQNLDKPIEAKLSEDGKILTISGAAGQQGSMTFEKNPS